MLIDLLPLSADEELYDTLRGFAEDHLLPAAPAQPQIARATKPARIVSRTVRSEVELPEDYVSRIGLPKDHEDLEKEAQLREGQG
jgi:hypothetical protein